MSKLWVPGVDEELHLHVVQQIQLKSLVPIEVQSTWPHNCSGLEIRIKLFYILTLNIKQNAELNHQFNFKHTFREAVKKKTAYFETLV